MMVRNYKVARILPRIIEFAKNDRSVVLGAEFSFIACETFTCEIDIIMRILVEDVEMRGAIVLAAKHAEAMAGKPLLYGIGIQNTTQPNGLAVPDATMCPIDSTSHVIELMQTGHNNRSMSATALNERSSRSHRTRCCKDQQGGQSCQELMDQLSLLKDTIAKKDDEIDRLQLANSSNSLLKSTKHGDSLLKHSTSSQGMTSLGKVASFDGRLSDVSDGGIPAGVETDSSANNVVDQEQDKTCTAGKERLAKVVSRVQKLTVPKVGQASSLRSKPRDPSAPKSSGLQLCKDVAESEEGKMALSAAVKKFKVLSSENLGEIAEHCNERKWAGRRAEEAGQKLYMWALIKNKETVVCNARVLGLGPRFMSVYEPKLVMEQRIYYDEVEGLSVEWLEVTGTLVLDACRNKPA
ncbi:DIS3-like exonuclease 2 [Zea mays]|uniref:DIS3-like exonuclease 2 n=1 Tax=Zea mays TaxID=4577 RepID=A0A3L6EZ01_MAIZE|nr:DIS3-like exonuclease 2 [Zea mays]